MVYPGKVEVGGNIYSVSTKFTVSGLSSYDSAACGLGGGLYVVAGPPASGEEITGSDLFLVQDSSIHVSSGHDGEGYYYGTKRLIGAVWNNPNTGSGCQSLMNFYNPDPPQKAFFVFGGSSSDNIVAPIFNADNVFVNGTADSLAFHDMSCYYDRDLGCFGYRAKIREGSAIDGLTLVNNEYSGGVMYDVFSTTSTRATLSEGVYGGSHLITDVYATLNISTDSAGANQSSVISVYIKPLPNLSGNA